MLRKKKAPLGEKGVTPMDAALKYLTARPRTVLETELYLDEQHFGEYEVYQVVERLKELGYLNDAQYAEDFVQTRLATKPVSRRKLREQLCAHKLPQEAVETALAAVTDEMEARNAAAVADKYYRQFAALEDGARRERVLRRLHARGYDYETIRQSVAAVIGDFAGDEYAAADAGEEE